MTLEQAKEILSAVKLAPPLAGYTFAQVAQALAVIAGAWAKPPIG